MENNKKKAEKDAMDMFNNHGKNFALELANSYLSDAREYGCDTNYWNYLVEEITKIKD